MKMSVIKKVAQEYSLEQLQAAENALYEEQSLEIEVEGEDEGEQLTHVLAAIFVKEHMAETGEDMRKAIRAYSQKVRNSIS
jgi:hypothetical protein